MLSDEAEKWLREFVVTAISNGLQNHSSKPTEDIFEELMETGWIKRTFGTCQCPDQTIIKTVKLTSAFAGHLHASLNVYGTLRMIIAGEDELSKNKQHIHEHDLKSYLKTSLWCPEYKKFVMHTSYCDLTSICPRMVKCSGPEPRQAKQQDFCIQKEHEINS